ncbi:hypothetical protein QEH53_21120 [Pelagicoccus sp. SDUM812002]|nr:hypothetical protein [Pelagicoccus sp. SDUM812002]
MKRRWSEAVKVEASVSRTTLKGERLRPRWEARMEGLIVAGGLGRSATGSEAAGESTRWGRVSGNAGQRSDAGEDAGPPRPRSGWRGEGPCYLLDGRGRLEQPDNRTRQANTEWATKR